MQPLSTDPLPPLWAAWTFRLDIIRFILRHVDRNACWKGSPVCVSQSQAQINKSLYEQRRKVNPWPPRKLPCYTSSQLAIVGTYNSGEPPASPPLVHQPSDLHPAHRPTQHRRTVEHCRLTDAKRRHWRRSLKCGFARRGRIGTCMKRGRCTDFA